jgi:hypothetical protein
MFFPMNPFRFVTSSACSLPDKRVNLVILRKNRFASEAMLKSKDLASAVDLHKHREVFSCKKQKARLSRARNAKFDQSTNR